MEKVFFERIIVSCEIEKPKSELEKLKSKDEAKRFRLELVASDCTQEIKELLHKDVVMDFSNLNKIKTENDRDYYLSHQKHILYF